MEPSKNAIIFVRPITLNINGISTVKVDDEVEYIFKKTFVSNLILWTSITFEIVHLGKKLDILKIEYDGKELSTSKDTFSLKIWHLLYPPTSQLPITIHFRQSQRVLPRHSLRRILTNDKYADTIIQAQDGLEIPAHRCILAQYSPVFRDFFDQSTATLPILLNIEDFNGDTILGALNYLYGNTNIVDNEAILMFADKYKIEHLKDAFRYYMEETLNVTNVVKYAEIAHEYGFTALRVKCLEYYNQHCVAIGD